MITRRFCAGWMLAILLCIGAAQADNAIRVAGDVSSPTDWTADQLKQQFAGEIKQIHFTSKGQPHVSDCVALLSLLKAAGAPTDFKMTPGADPKTKNLPLRLVVVVAGRDGYAVTFSLAELLPQFGNKDVWLALDIDGNPLVEHDGPARLIVPDDVKPGRWVYAVTSVTVIDTSTTQPSSQP